MTEGMGGDVFGDAGGAGVFFYDPFYATGGEATVISGGGSGLEVFRIV